MANGAIVPLAKQHEELLNFAIEDFRDKFLFAFEIMVQGLPEQWAKHARKIEAFFREGTTPEIWAQLSQIPDPENPGQSIAESWLSQWENLNAIVGKKDDANAAA